MFQPRSIQSSMTFRDKIMSMDYVLVLSILLLGIISMFAMYSTDGGKFDYHTKSHILRFGVFFLMFFIISLFQILIIHYLEINMTLFNLTVLYFTVFIIAWIGQFIGHKIEGQKPSFFEDLQFLLIGPAWLLSFDYKKMNIKY